MRLFSAFVFLIFSFLCFQAQAQGFIPGPNLEYDFNQFDWQAFSDKENVQKYIDFRRGTLEVVPARITNVLNLGKADLIRLEQELELYKRGIKTGLSSEEIQLAEEAIQRHWENINNISVQIQGYAELGAVEKIRIPLKKKIESIEDFHMGAWELYKGDHKVLFNMVEKTDQNLYNLLGNNDEAYAELILPQVEKYTKQMGKITQSYYDSLWSATQNQDLSDKNMDHLIDTYSSSLQIYNCFKKNFKNPVKTHQIALMNTIESWYGQQSALGAKGLIEAYTKGIVSNPWFVVSKLHRFTPAPQGVKAMIAEFYRKDILNNKDFINTEDDYKLGARVDALVGLKYLGFLNSEEQQLFDQAIKAGVIEKVGKGNYFSGSSRPLP